MGKPAARYCLRARAGVGWQIWDRKLNRWWGRPSRLPPHDVLARLVRGGDKSDMRY